ncbi:MAG: thiamine-phosphate kinase [Methanomicrobiales archaeon]
MDERALLQEVYAIIGKEHCLDDCAVIPCGEQFLVATTDMLHETTDFPAGMTDWQIGWMSAAVTLSDIASMGATPSLLLLAVGLDDPSRLGEILRGARDCCLEAGGYIAGGDIDHHTELTIVSSGIGMVAPDHILRRSGARVGDLVCVTGVLGCAQAALNGYHQYDKALMEPRARVHEGEVLGRTGATSMMDISDGLAISLYDLLEANSCGYSIHREKIPFPDGVPADEATTLALYGGGDYELLFTVPHDWVAPPGFHYSVIGTVIPDHCVRLDGNVMVRKGYEHTWV